MKKCMKNLLPVVLGLVASEGYSTFLPPNNLHLQDNINIQANMSKAEFEGIMEKAREYYGPVVEGHNAVLNIVGDWNNGTVNAYAQQIGKEWRVQMFGGLARRPETTHDGFALVICHELGHHLGGFPYSSGWAANEGQSDYFATLACARRLWQDEPEVNETYRKTIAAYPKEVCDKSWADPEDQNLCYRSMQAGHSLGHLLGSLGGTGEPSFDTPDKSKVSRTNNAHPKAQCRLDTYMAGSVCSNGFDDDLIPKTEKESASVTCTTFDSYEVGTRPLCWYKPTL